MKTADSVCRIESGGVMLKKHFVLGIMAHNCKLISKAIKRILWS
jgi:hypothetical protein